MPVSPPPRPGAAAAPPPSPPGATTGSTRGSTSTSAPAAADDLAHVQAQRVADDEPARLERAQAAAREAHVDAQPPLGSGPAIDTGPGSSGSISSPPGRRQQPEFSSTRSG